MNWNGIIQADALNIPLVDESVAMVCTSPPYWGLRAYKIPESIFGGDPTCEHDWLEQGVKGGGAGKQGSTSQRVGRGNVNVQVVCCQSREKYLYCKTGDILIDDWEKYKAKWIGAGGNWITHTSAANSIAALKELGY